MTVYDVISDHANVLIEATHTPSNTRSRFYTVEHFNLGKGWMLRDAEGRVGGIVLDSDLADPVPTTTRACDAVAGRLPPGAAILASGRR